MNISTNSKIFELNKEGACSFTYKRPCKPWIMNVQMNKKHTLSVTPNKPTYSNQNQKGPERISQPERISYILPERISQPERISY